MGREDPLDALRYDCIIWRWGDDAALERRQKSRYKPTRQSKPWEQRKPVLNSSPPARVINADSIDHLKTLEANSVDAVVTDPPYGLGNCSPRAVTEALAAWVAGEEYKPRGAGFMGKSWDAFVPGPELWREVYRVLKPGGHAIIFAGSRTVDLMGISGSPRWV